MKKELTKIQNKTLEFILKFYNKKGEFPRVKDVVTKFNISSGAASDRISMLVKNGWLVQKNHKIIKSK